MPVVQELCGHASAAIQRVYTHLGLDATTQAVRALPGVDGLPTAEQSPRDALEGEIRKLLPGASTPILEQVLGLLKQG